MADETEKSIADDVKQVGKDVGSMALSAGKATIKGLSGDLVGAGVELVKNPKIIKAIGILVEYDGHQSDITSNEEYMISNAKDELNIFLEQYASTANAKIFKVEVQTEAEAETLFKIDYNPFLADEQLLQILKELTESSYKDEAKVQALRLIVELSKIDYKLIDNEEQKRISRINDELENLVELHEFIEFLEKGE